MRVTVSFCGGCNPRHRRGALLEKWKVQFPALAFCIAEPDERPAVAISGCERACVSGALTVDGSEESIRQTERQLAAWNRMEAL